MKSQLRVIGAVTLSLAVFMVDAFTTVMGFTPEAIGRVFDPFFTTKTEGMGMGLSICRSIIEAQGGHILVSNNQGPGATVTFTVPATPANT